MATTDVISLDEGMAAVAMVGGGAKHGEAISLAIEAVSEAMDDYAGPIVQRTVTDELHYPSGSLIFLEHYPVISVTTVTEYSSGTPTVLTAEDFDTAGDYLLRDGAISRRSGFYTTGWYGQTVKVTYEAGRFATTDDVTAKYRMAAKAALTGWWSKQAPAWARGGDPFGDPSTGGFGPGFFDELRPVFDRWIGSERRHPAVA